MAAAGSRCRIRNLACIVAEVKGGVSRDPLKVLSLVEKAAAGGIERAAEIPSRHPGPGSADAAAASGGHAEEVPQDSDADAAAEDEVADASSCSVL